MATPDERINEAQAAIESSLRQSFKTGMSEVEQAFHAAEQEGEQIVGDPATTRPDELPPQYRPNTAVLTLADLISWGIPEATIVDYAQQGLLGQEYMSWAPSTLREHVMMAGKQLQRQAMIDAGKYAGKTVADPILEAYWEGKAPHPRRSSMFAASRTSPLLPASSGSTGGCGRSRRVASIRACRWRWYAFWWRRPQR